MWMCIHVYVCVCSGVVWIVLPTIWCAFRVPSIDDIHIYIYTYIYLIVWTHLSIPIECPAVARLIFGRAFQTYTYVCISLQMSSSSLPPPKCIAISVSVSLLRGTCGGSLLAFVLLILIKYAFPEWVCKEPENREWESQPSAMMACQRRNNSIWCIYI